MSETINKLTPDRDLQCYFERPSAIAAMSGSGAHGFTVSGTWRQQFDWAVIEWNRDNVFEHPLFRYLPDGDLSGLTLTYDEVRTNCVPLDSKLFPTVDWPYLRIWADNAGHEEFYQVRLADHVTAIEGSYSPASAEFELQGTPTSGDFAGIGWSNTHFTAQFFSTTSLADAAEQIKLAVNGTGDVTATRTGSKVRLEYNGADGKMGANGNRLGAYTQVSGAGTESWSPASATFSGGTSPTKWRVTLDFSNLTDILGRTVPMTKVRKMRWTYAADLQAGAFQRTEFSVVVSNWTVSGARRAYSVAGPGSRRIEDGSKLVQYSGTWSSGRGNFSGGSIHNTGSVNSSITIPYQSAQNHQLLLGTRYVPTGATISVQVDGGTAQTFNLTIAGEDVLCRIPFGSFGPGTHTVVAKHVGAAGSQFYFDFLEIAIPAATVADRPIDAKTTLATDWDTDHSIALPPERTAWMIHALGFRGRANHYVGALWFYELTPFAHQYASVTADFVGTPATSGNTKLTIGRVGESATLDINHLNLFGDTAATIAKAFELEINNGFTGIRAESSGGRLTIFARAMGSEGNKITVSATPSSGSFHVDVASSTLTGGTSEAVWKWHTDLAASPRINRAARDWTQAYFARLHSYGIDGAVAFSTELQHGDDSLPAGIAQRYYNGDPVWVNTPALQTNFSPASQAFWKDVYKDAAGLLVAAGVQPYLQFGEVQWWYFPASATSGMTFYDDYSKTAFQTANGRPMQQIASGSVDPAPFATEGAFLAAEIGTYTTNIMSYVKAAYSNCRFEVLYPTDVNQGALNRLVNFPASAWTSANLDCLKTESFGFTFARNLNLSRVTIDFAASHGFAPSKRSFLVGIGDATTTWIKEWRMARAAGVESIVLFALDQFCLIGYRAPMPRSLRRATKQG